MSKRSKDKTGGDATTGPKLWVVLARAYASLAEFVEKASAEEGLGLSDFMVLEALLHKGPMTISELGEKVLLAAPSMTSAVDRLEKLNCAVRKTSPEDRRIRLIELTTHGRQFITELYPRHAQTLEKIAGALSQTEKDQLRRSLKKLGFAAAAYVQDGSVPITPVPPPRKQAKSSKTVRK